MSLHSSIIDSGEDPDASIGLHSIPSELLMAACGYYPARGSDGTTVNRSLKTQTCKLLLSLSRFFRDRVLRQIRMIRQLGGELGQHADGFLDRACKTAPQGLTLELGNPYPDIQKWSLSVDDFGKIMDRALNSKWEKVEELHVAGHHLEEWALKEDYCSSSSCYPLTYVGLAFPCLRRLYLSWCDVDHSMFLSLLSCRQLEWLELKYTEVNQRCILPAAHALARISSLKGLGIEGEGKHDSTNLQLLQQLSGLNTLRLVDLWSSDAEVGSGGGSWWELVCRQHQLQSLTVQNGFSDWFCAGHRRTRQWPSHLQHLLSQCTQLVELNLLSCVLDAEGLQVLLTQGQQLRRVQLEQIVIDAPLPYHAQCQWTHLKLGFGSLKLLAYLPLQSVQTLEMQGGRVGILHLPRGNLPLSEITSLLSQAATNLSQTPAWQRQPQAQPATISLVPERMRCPGYGETDMRQGAISLTPLIAALAPLSNRPDAISFCMDLPVPGMELREGDIEALTCTFGPKLVHLRLKYISLHDSAWAALSSKLPTLRSLTVLGGLSRDRGRVKPSAMMDYCHRRGSSPPDFLLKIDRFVWPEPLGTRAAEVEEQLNASLRALSCQHVTVRLIMLESDA